MRALFLLLVLANLVFFAWAHLAREEAGVAKRIRQLEIAPGKIRLLRAEPAPAAAPSAPGQSMRAAPNRPALGMPAACLEWGIFAGPAVGRAEAALATLGLPRAQITRAVTDAGGYWVYMPPQKSRADADRKIGELRELGVTDFFLVHEPAQWRNAISLGIFRTGEAAQAFLAKLRDQGVRSAVAGRRENVLKQVAFHVREPDGETVARVTALQQEFPGSELKAGPCPAGVTVVRN